MRAVQHLVSIVAEKTGWTQTIYQATKIQQSQPPTASKTSWRIIKLQTTHHHSHQVNNKTQHASVIRRAIPLAIDHRIAPGP